MEHVFKTTLWSQFGAAIDMLENALRMCTDELCVDGNQQPEFWYICYHTLFWMDLYLSDTPEGFRPPEPFGMEEFDPAGIVPETPHHRSRLLVYLDHCRKKCRERIDGLTPESSAKRFKIGRVDLTIAELLLYNMRHVQHHTGQLQTILRHNLDKAPRWQIAAT